MSSPKRSVTNPNPSVSDCWNAMTTNDYLLWTGATVANWSFGMLRGAPARFTMAGLCAGVGFTFGSILAFQNSRSRVMGVRANAK
jgi:hypothetical protein